MSRKPETLFVSKIKHDLKQLPNSWFFKTQEQGRVGIPDIICCLNGYFIAIEAKVGKNKATAIQEHTIMEMVKAGAIAAIVTPEQWPSLLDSLKKIAYGDDYSLVMSIPKKERNQQ